jgi:hypothetical protein
VLLEEQCFAMTTSRGDDIWRDCADNPIMARKVKMPLSEPHGSSKPSNARPFDAHHGLANELPVVATEWTRRNIEDTDEEAATHASTHLHFLLDTPQVCTQASLSFHMNLWFPTTRHDAIPEQIESLQHVITT